MGAMTTQGGTLASSDDWDKHWNEHAAMLALNPAVAFRRRLVIEMLSLSDANGPVRLLELGCGTGLFARDVLRAHPEVEFVGLDLSVKGVEIAGRNVPAAHFFQQDFTQPLRLEERYHGWATHVVCSEVLEHLDDPVAMLRNVRALFAPGCRIIVTVPAGPLSAFAKHIGHRRHYTQRLLETTLHQAGLVVAELRGAGFPFYNLYLLATIARGKKLIEDAGGQNGATPSLAARLGMRVFSPLFKLNLNRSNLGWQVVAIAAEPLRTGDRG
jgi:2-polyprenyl-3-methyl-5-hydroxy-6-metoxy-1,4-benzoquinol methylase